MTLSPELDNTSMLDRLLLRGAIEDFYYYESNLLDELKFQEWVDLFTDDTHYFMPLRRTMTRRELGKQFTEPGQIAFFDDTKQILEGRIKKLATNKSWAEDPPSRTRHFISNVRVVEDDGTELTVEANFHLYRTRLKSEEQSWYGMRRDVLRREGESFRIASRHIFLETTVLMSRNLSNFF